MAFPGRSLLWQLVCTVVKYGPLLLWHMIHQKPPPHMSFTSGLPEKPGFLKRLLKAFLCKLWKDSWVSRKVLILTACSAKQVRCPFFSIGSDASYKFWNSLLSSNNPLLEKVVRADFLIANSGLIRFCTNFKISLHLSSNFWISYDLANLSIWNSSSSLCTYVSSGAGESLTIWHHMIITIPAELWGLITHILMYLWGLLLAGGMTEKEITSLCYLSTFAWIFPKISAVHFLAFAFLAMTFWSKECVIIGIEGLMSSGSVTIVTGNLFRMRNTFCWTVRMNTLLAFAYSTASWSSHLNVKIAHEDFFEPTRYLWCGLFCS